MIVLGAVAGALLIGQLVGIVRWSGPLAFAPAALMIGSLNGPLIAAVRAALRWLGG
jgi:hypothetical protein